MRGPCSPIPEQDLHGTAEAVPRSGVSNLSTDSNGSATRGCGVQFSLARPQTVLQSGGKEGLCTATARMQHGGEHLWQEVQPDLV